MFGCPNLKRSWLGPVKATLFLLGSLVWFTILLPTSGLARPKPGDDRHEFTSGNFRYEVTFRGKPKTESKQVSYGPKPEQIINVTTRKWETNEGVFSLTTADYPEALAEVDPKILIDGVRDGLRGPANLGGTIDQDQTILIGESKLPGRSLLIHAQKNYIAARLVYLPPRLFQIMVTGTEKQVKSAASTKFLDSFRCDKLKADGQP